MGELGTKTLGLGVLALGLCGGCTGLNPSFGSGTEGETEASSEATSRGSTQGQTSLDDDAGDAPGTTADPNSTSDTGSGSHSSTAETDDQGVTTDDPSGTTGGVADTGFGSTGEDNCPPPNNGGAYVYVYSPNAAFSGDFSEMGGGTGLSKAATLCGDNMVTGCSAALPILWNPGMQGLEAESGLYPPVEVVSKHPGGNCLLADDAPAFFEQGSMLSLAEAGVLPTGDTIWTGVNTREDPATCGEWTSNGGGEVGYTGSANDAGPFWLSENKPVDCGEQHHLVCMCWSDN